MASKPDVVFVLGAPGAGKGTQCQKIVEKFGYVHLSAGDLLRAERKRPGSKYGELIETHITNGIIVPVEITCHLLDEAMEESSSNKFLIDGFPRNQNNLDGWNQEMKDKANVQCVLFIECSEKTCIDRCLKRGEAGSGRTDDNIDSLKKRFNTFYNDTMPVVDHYAKMDMVVRVSGEDDPDLVFKTICEKFEKF